MSEPSHELRTTHTRAHYDRVADFYRDERQDLQGGGRTLLTLAVAVAGSKLLAWHHLDPDHPQLTWINGLLLASLVCLIVGALCQITSLARHQPARVQLPHDRIDESVEDDRAAEHAALTTAHHLAGLGELRLRAVRRLHALSGGFIGLGIVLAVVAFAWHSLGR